MVISQCWGWITIRLFSCPPPFESSQRWVHIVVIMLLWFHVGCIVLYCIVLRCVALRCVALHCIAFYFILLYYGSDYIDTHI